MSDTEEEPPKKIVVKKSAAKKAAKKAVKKTAAKKAVATPIVTAPIVTTPIVTTPVQAPQATESSENYQQKTLAFSSDEDKGTSNPPEKPVKEEGSEEQQNRKNRRPQHQNQNRRPQHQNRDNKGRGDNNRKNNRHDQGGNRQNQNNPNNKNKKKSNQRNPRKKQGVYFFENEQAKQVNIGELAQFEALASIASLNEFKESLEFSSEDTFSFYDIYKLGHPQLLEAATANGIDLDDSPRRDTMINSIMDANFKKGIHIITEGILDIREEGHGFIVYEYDNYKIKEQSAYVPKCLIKNAGLLPGHILKAEIHPKRETESCPFAYSILSINDLQAEEINALPPFTELIPYYPLERIIMETSEDAEWDNSALRIVDLISPIGFGQRGLIVAPPRTGKTVLLQAIANSIQTNNPNVHLIVLLVDERPEEVTDFKRQVNGEVISSTFDEDAESHVHAAEMVIEKSRRMVECGKHVVILLDSITRLARAYNTLLPSSGKILSGGVEANALQRPKRFFGSARNIEGGGSLTIMATALVETGSKMDEVIFEEFKGTGNMELHLDRALVEKRIYPAIEMGKSGTRKEELLYHPDELNKIYSLRRAMKGVPPVDAMESLIQRIKRTKSNAEFLMTLSH